MAHILNKKVKAHMAQVSQKKIRILYNENNDIFKGQGNPLLHYFEGLPTGYLWAKLHNGITIS